MITFEAICTAIGTYGIPVVIIAALAYISYKWVTDRSSDKKKKNDTEINVKLYQAISQIVMDAIKNSPCSTLHTVEEQELDRKFDDIIQEQLDGLVRNGASRSYYWVFHNGGKDVVGRGLLKMSMKNESSGTGTRVMTNYQNLPRSIYPILYKNLDSNDGFYLIENIDDIENTDSGCYYFIKGNGAKSAIFRVLRRDDGLIIGFIGCEYLNPIEASNKQDVIQRICSVADIIAGVLLAAK